MKIREKNWKRTCLGMLAAVMLLAASLIFLDIRANAENIKIGTVYGIDAGSSLSFREGAGKSYGLIKKLYNGDTGEILDQTTVIDSEGKAVVWYKMNVTGDIGWSSSEYIRVTEYTVAEDKDFETYLTEQGFPESYKSKLRVLHNKYPNWIFEAQQTDLTWDEVIEAESVLGRNLVHKNKPSSWKSIATGAYNWETSTWEELDTSYVAASSEIIQYYMDPRNFLDDSTVFQFLKQSYDANKDYTNSLTLMVQGSFLAGSFIENNQNKTYVSAIIEAASQSGVSPYTIATMIIQEQGRNGGGGCISGNESGYEGYYNFFNVGAYAEGNLTAVQRGLRYAQQTDVSTLRPWNTRTKSIAGGAKIYGTNYVNVGQDTIYLKKFDLAPYGGLYNHQYMTNIQGAASEGSILSEAYDQVTRQSSLVFKIPVYKNMPETACTQPTGDGSPNYMLKSLEVAGQSLTPTFSMYETAYSVIVPYECASVKISASVYDTSAKIDGVGNKNLSVGTNTIEVKVTAPYGNVRTYTINIVRQADTSLPSGTPVPTISSSLYAINSSSKIVTGIKPSTSASAFLNGFTVTNGAVQVVKADGSMQTGYVGTGNKLNIYDNANQLKNSYDIIIYGDTDGDGSVYTLDYIRIKKHILGSIQLSGCYKLAADTSRNGQIDTLDYIQVKKQILGKYTIQQ